VKDLRTRLAVRRAQARRVLWVERIWPALWPAFALIGAWIALSLFDLPAMLPIWWHIGVLGLVVVALGVVLWRGLHPIVRPTDAEVDRRLELTSGVRHRPLVVLDDKPADTDPAMADLWQAHLARAADQVARLRAGWPHPGIPQRDVWATRAALAVLLVAGLVMAGPEAPARLLRAVSPGLPDGVPTPAPQLQVWLTPPSYTGLAPIFLHPDTPAAPIPAGSHLTVNLTGGSSAPTMRYGDVDMAFATLDATSWQAERDITQAGILTVTRRGSALGHWTLTVIADHPPTVAWAEPPGPVRGQRRLQTRLPWTASDDYGVVSLQAELRLKDRPSAPPLVIPLPVPGGATKQVHGAALQDLTANPWAGLPVIATLVAKDAPGQRATSADAGFILPERPFKNPLARAVLDIRKRLSVTPENHSQAAADLSALAGAPEAFDNNTAVYLALTSTASLLDRSGDPAEISEAQSRLWSLALQLEDDAVARTAQAVQAARDALQQAVKKGDKTDMDRKADELRREIQKHLQALADKARKDGTLMPFDPSQRTLNQQDFDKLTQEMKNAARAGRMDEAQDKLQQLEKMLDQLKQAEANPSQDRQQARQQRQKGQQQMGAAEDMVQREGAMKGRATGRDTAEDKPGRETDQKQQKALRRALGQMMQNFGDLTGKVPDALSQADIAMDQAGQALGQGKDKDAGAAQQRAIEALQKGEQQMSQQMAQSLGISIQPGQGEGQGDGPGDQMANDDGQGGDGQGDGRGGQQDADSADNGGQPGDGQAPDVPRDPLGRPTKDGTSGRADGGDVHVPDQMEQARTREIQTELRRREGQRTRPPGELDYIDRLLKAY
jgi:uncharacterized protein (TIGR02302 family)